MGKQNTHEKSYSLGKKIGADYIFIISRYHYTHCLIIIKIDRKPKYDTIKIHEYQYSQHADHVQQQP